MEKRHNQPHHHQQPPPSSSSLPSHEDVCKRLFEHHRNSMYRLLAKFYAGMVAVCPGPDMEEIKKAVRNGDRKEAFKIMNRLFEGYTASGDLHRMNAEIYVQVAADCSCGDLTMDKDLLAQDLKKGIDSATRSVQLSPDNIENHFVLVSLLSLVAHDAQGRKLVIKKCKEALEIHDKDDQQGPTSTRSKIIDILRAREREAGEA